MLPYTRHMMTFYYKTFRSVCFARRGTASSCVCESRSPRLISGGLRPPYPRCVLVLFSDSPAKCGGYLFLLALSKYRPEKAGRCGSRVIKILYEKKLPDINNPLKSKYQKN